jgi:hypothetical protein
MLARKNQMPGFNDHDGKFVIHERNAKLIKDHKGQIFKFKDLPQTAQFAAIQYMAIDGEAWYGPKNWTDPLPNVWGDINNYSLYVEGCREIIADNLQYFIATYGEILIGYVVIQAKALHDQVVLDEDFPKDAPSYHEMRLKINRGKNIGEKHNYADWPVILSSFPEETLQDGWSRLWNYFDQGAAEIPAIFYPKPTKAQTRLEQRIEKLDNLINLARAT